MSAFTDAEIAFLRSQRLGRLATVGAGGKPHVVPMGYRYETEADAIDIGGLALERTKKWRDIQANPHVAFVVDAVVSVDPWTARGLEVRGRAEPHVEGGEQLGPGFGSTWLRIQVERIVAWGIDADAYGPPNARNV